MATRVIEKPDWENYLNRVSKELGTRLVEVEVTGRDIGDQVEAEGVVLAGLSYDPKDDVVAVDLVSKDDRNVEHLVHKPVELVVDEEITGLNSLVVTDSDDHRTVLKLKEPLPLPAPE